MTACAAPRSATTRSLLALSVFALILLASVLYTKVFSGRGAFIHVGAFVGTIMAFNVFAVIIPNQKKMIAQMIAGQTPEARYGMIGKQRSMHNNYLTLPVLLMMVSQHYPFLFSHPQSWLVVALILLSGGLFRHILNRIDAGDDWDGYGWALPVAAFALLARSTSRRRKRATPRAGRRRHRRAGAGDHAEALHHCHAKAPTHDAFKEPPKNVSLETLAEMRRWAKLILVQTVQNRAMPIGNQTGMTDDEREKLGRWINGAEMSAPDPQAIGAAPRRCWRSLARFRPSRSGWSACFSRPSIDAPPTWSRNGCARPA